MEVTYILDFEALKGKNGEFVVKELSISPVNSAGQEVHTWTFEAPSPWYILDDETRQTNVWLIRNRHHLSWRAGRTPYRYLRDILQRNLPRGCEVYVKGVEKADFIARIVNRPVRELGAVGCPKVSALNCTYCCKTPDHVELPIEHCSHVKVKAYAEWCAANFMEIDYQKS